MCKGYDANDVVKQAQECLTRRRLSRAQSHVDNAGYDDYETKATRRRVPFK